MLRKLKKWQIWLLAVIIVMILVVGVVINTIFTQTKASSYNPEIEQLIEQRIANSQEDEGADIFGDSDVVRVLVLGLDRRLGEEVTHCDAIQMIEINREIETITITAVPRGTYSPLPGGPYAETEYYISKACEIGGLEYGIERIEYILGKEADYVVMVGFSQALGVLRYIGLPATETLQWLRHRQGYAIGEPQRARNHSNFLKTLLIEYVPTLNDRFGTGLKKMIFSLTDTDLTYTQAQQMVDVVQSFNLSDRPESINLQMRPAYQVQDFEFDPEMADEHVQKLLDPITDIIPEHAYVGTSREESQNRIKESIYEGLDSDEFVEWSFENYIWLQIDDAQEREDAHFAIMKAYALNQEALEEKQSIIISYILEKENLNLAEYEAKGRELLEEILSSQKTEE